jgi:membrane fusion protein (multidrug efflux system)
LEVDISDKAHAVIKYGFVTLLALAFLCAGSVWLYQSSHRTLSIVEAEVVGHMVQARARAAGTVEEVLINDGDVVAQGQVLAKIKVKVSPDQIQQLESNLALSKRNLEELQVGIVTMQPVFGGGGGEDVEAARSRYEKTQFLYDVGGVSAQERDAAEAAYHQALAGGSVSYQTVTLPPNPESIRRAELQVRQAEAALAAAQQASGATELTAPVAGVAYRVDIAEGKDIHPGEVVFRIGDTGDLWIEAYAAPSYKELLFVGQMVSYTLGGHDFLGSVTEIVEPSEANGTDAPKGTEGTRPDNPHADKLTIRISIPSHEGVLIRPAERTTVKVSLN